MALSNAERQKRWREANKGKTRTTASDADEVAMLKGRVGELEAEVEATRDIVLRELRDEVGVRVLSAANSCASSTGVALEAAREVARMGFTWEDVFAAVEDQADRAFQSVFARLAHEEMRGLSEAASESEQKAVNLALSRSPMNLEISENYYRADLTVDERRMATCQLLCAHRALYAMARNGEISAPDDEPKAKGRRSAKGAAGGLC